MRRLLVLCLAVVGLLAGCGGSAAPFFVVRNDSPAAARVTFCPIQACPRPQQRLMPPGTSWRVVDTSRPSTGVGVLSARVVGHGHGCEPLPAPIRFVDRLVIFRVSTFVGDGCAGYNPARPTPAMR